MFFTGAIAGETRSPARVAGEPPTLGVKKACSLPEGEGLSLAVPRSERKTVLVGVRFSRRSNDRGGQAPALRARKGFSSPCAFGSRCSRTTVSCSSLTNLGNLGNPAHLWCTRAIAGDRPPRYGRWGGLALAPFGSGRSRNYSLLPLILLIVIILQILLLSC